MESLWTILIDSAEASTSFMRTMVSDHNSSGHNRGRQHLSEVCALLLDTGKVHFFTPSHMLAQKSGLHKRIIMRMPFLICFLQKRRNGLSQVIRHLSQSEDKKEWRGEGEKKGIKDVTGVQRGRHDGGNKPQEG